MTSPSPNAVYLRDRMCLLKVLRMTCRIENPRESHFDHSFLALVNVVLFDWTKTDGH